MSTKKMMWAAQINLCLKDLSMPSGFLKAALEQMANEMKTLDKEAEEFKELSYYAQVLHGAIQSIEATSDVISGLSLLMAKELKF